MRVAGVDLAMARNSSAVAMGEHFGPRKRITHVREWKPDGRPMVPSVVCGEIAAECKRWGVSVVAADLHYIETLREALDAVRIELVQAPAKPSDAWLPTQEDILEGRIDIIPHERLRLQLQAAKLSYEPGGITKVHQDVASDGSHGDIASAMVLANWLLHETESTGRMLSASGGHSGWARHTSGSRVKL